MATLQKNRKALARYFTDPAVWLLKKTPITPDALTWTGAVIAVGAAVLAATGHLFAAGWVVAFSGLFDLLDGALARETNRASRFGAVLDSTLDRAGEAAVMAGLLVFYARQASAGGVILVSLALIGSYLVSYIRARAEGMGLKCEVGVFTRPERVVILSLGLLLAGFGRVLPIALGLIAGMSWVTAGQRLYHVYRETKTK
ncbi:MAG: CDP-alcohol phosphatidyltransferase family protein [Dehalococcoidia bacterium]|nr:CDP-alcohol phosphatidyltransferase family protein [Dehalococcoidia bacterium]